MARSVPPPTPSEEAYSQWTKIKAYCPICNELITRSYCRNCGIPNNNNGYFIYEDQLFRFGPPRFRPNDIIGEYQLCGKCGAPNPYNVNYCKSCGGDITLCAKDKNGHGWVDLGLSVLWSTEAMRHMYMWNDNNIIYAHDLNDLWDLYRKKQGFGGKDAATYDWGAKWRTPTKEEFEELITKCKWEKCLTSDINYDVNHKVNQYAFKVTGPNGNSIVITSNLLCISYSVLPIEYRRGEIISYWTASCDSGDNKKAYRFRFIPRTCEWYFECLHFLGGLSSPYNKNDRRSDSGDIKKRISYYADKINKIKDIKNTTIYKSGIIEKFKEAFKLIKQSIGTNTPYSEDKLRKLEWDIERLINDNRYELWMENPEITIESNLGCCASGRTFMMIRPVADKKWKGCL
jgi:ribosomal protein L40E